MCVRLARAGSKMFTAHQGQPLKSGGLAHIDDVLVTTNSAWPALVCGSLSCGCLLAGKDILCCRRAAHLGPTDSLLSHGLSWIFLCSRASLPRCSDPATTLRRMKTAVWP